MPAQLPPEVAGVAAAVLVYSFLCLASGLFLLWLVWVHEERKSYVAMLAGFASLHTLASIIQQIHTIARWRDIKTEQHANVVANVGNPELNITGASTGLDLVLFYIQYYAYNVESLLVLFWAVELANSIFQFRLIRAYRVHASLFAKATAAVLPAVQMVLLRFSGVDKSTAGFMALADAIMIGCFAAGTLILFAILARYVHSRVTLASWNVHYGQSTSAGGTHGSAPRPGAARPRGKTYIYDRWLVLRFTVAFVALSLFQVVVINFQLRAAATNTAAHVAPAPDLSADRARADFALFAPAPTAVLFIFLVFGTTRAFRETMWRLFVPRALRDRAADRRRRKQLRGEAGPGVSALSGGHSAVEQGPAGAERGSAAAADIKLRDLGGDGRSDEWPILKGGGAGRGRR